VNAVSAFTVLSRSRVGIFYREDIGALTKTDVAEIAAVAAAAGVDLPPSAGDRVLSDLCAMPPDLGSSITFDAEGDKRGFDPRRSGYRLPPRLRDVVQGLDPPPASGTTVVDMTTNGRFWTVGELAKAAGVTVRTLHHYDDLGLLRPTERSEAGYRIYDEQGVDRLYRILVLRDLGFPLSEVASLLDADAGSLDAATRAQLDRTEQGIAEAESLRGRLTGLLRAQEQPRGPTSEELIETMEAMSMSVKLTRIYTRQGDGGETDRAEGSRVAKDDPVIEAGGEVDELCAQLGFALSIADAPGADHDRLRRIQNDLFDLGAELSASPPARQPGAPRVDERYVRWLEEACDELNAELPALDSFLLPGGSPYAAQLQVCRAVCRRTERRVLASGEASAEMLAYLNRLSDFLFILARSAPLDDEALWRPWSRR
jgi:cob(I)alamin adenosyltransferase